MHLDERLTELRTATRATLWRLQTFVRVGRAKGIPGAVTRSGAAFLLRSLPRGRAPGPASVLRFLAANGPHRIGLVRPDGLVRGGEDRHWSFFEMNQIVERIATALAARGMRPGSAALLMMKNRPEFLLVQLALGSLGAAAVSASWRSTVPELVYLAAHSGSKAIFFDVDVAETVRAARLDLERGGLRPDGFFVVGAPPAGAPHTASPGAPLAGFTPLDELVASAGNGAPVDFPDAGEQSAVVMYTSGTTGKPKGAVRKFDRNGAAGIMAFLGETPMVLGQTHLAVCPLYHATAFGFTTFTYILGGSVVVLPEFRAETFLEAVQRYRINTTALVPTMLQRLVDLGREKLRSYDTSSLQAIFSGGAPLSAPLAAQVMDLLGDKLWNFYGATETGVVTLAGPADLRASPGTIGRLVPGNEVRLIDDAGRDCPEGGVGELWVRSPSLIAGYHHDEAATKASTLQGYFSVGDVARKDARGCYHLEGRKRDMIITGGVNVYPAEVEAVLDAHPAVIEAAVVGVPDREWGERVRAFVVRRPEIPCDEAELKAFCKARLSGPKVPRDIVFLESLPRNPTGKVLKRELRELTGP